MTDEHVIVVLRLQHWTEHRLYCETVFLLVLVVTLFSRNTHESKWS